MSDLLLVALGGAMGAPARYLADRWVSARTDGFPWGTITVNVVGSLLLGVLAGFASDTSSTWLLTLAGTGFCGALTTFSTFSYETVRLVEEGRSRAAVANVALSLLVGLAACAAGYAFAA